MLRSSVGTAVVVAGGCRTVVVPPAAPEDPRAVYLVDYGRHTSVLLPEDSGGFVEYAYGEWSWYALDRTEWYHAFGTVLWPTRGTLGRRSLGFTGDHGAIERSMSAERVLAVEVAGANVTALRDRLAAEYDAHRETQHFQPAYGLTFVHHDDAYWLLHNCNQVTADWLRLLGCRIKGWGLSADFEVRAETEGDPDAGPDPDPDADPNADPDADADPGTDPDAGPCAALL